MSGRSIIQTIWNNFKQSIVPRKHRSVYMGDDYFGNKYYEIPGNPGSGRHRAERYFVPKGGKECYHQELTAEWDAWMRGRRDDAPTKEELMKNLQIMEMKKINAAKLDQQFGVKPLPNVTGINFPVHDDNDDKDKENKDNNNDQDKIKN